jgi:hypothetical protein
MRLPFILAAAALSLLALAGAAHAAEPESPVVLAAQNAMWWGDFAEVERQNTVFRQPNPFAPDGQSRLDQFRDGLNNVFQNNVENVDSYLTEIDRLTLEWATAHPKSALAHILHAKALVEHGWSYRGQGYARDVPPEAWKDFGEYLRRAADYFRSHADVALTDSYAHLVLLQIGRGLGWAPEQMAAIADDGAKRNPDDLDLYFQTMGTMTPKWGGNAKLLDNYIKQVTEQTRKKYGWGMYARLYWSATDSDYGHRLFEESFADWGNIKQGWEDLLARYPDSPRFLNRYAYMACIAKDGDTFRKLLARLDQRIDSAQWGPNPERSVEGCRRWASEL